MIKWSAAGLIAISVLHMLVLGMAALPSLSHWLSGGLWTMAHAADYAAQPLDILISGAAFWASLSSFAVPSIILGAMVIGMVRRGQRVPLYVGWGLLAWSTICSLVMEPSGFPAGIVLSGIMLVGLYRQPRPAPASGRV